MLISDRIFEIMKKKGISQKEFSKRTGIPQSTISDWKGKRVNPSSDKIMIICQALDSSPYEILSGIEKDKYQPVDFLVIDKKSEECRLIEQYRRMKPEDQARLMGYMEAILERAT